MSGELDVLAIITPAPGKAERVKELLQKLAGQVKANEKGVTKYSFFEQYGGENGNVIVVEEKYESQDAYDAHFKTDYFQALGKAIQEEGLLAGPLDIKTIKPLFGH